MAGTVIVASKDPGRLTLRLCRKTTQPVPVLGGGFRDEEMWVPDMTVKPVVLNGTGVKWGEQRDWQMAHGFALTVVDADFWKAWCDQNRGSPLLTSGLIFASAKQADVMARAKDYRTLRSGLEPIDPSKPFRMSGGIEVTADPSGVKPDINDAAERLGEAA